MTKIEEQELLTRVWELEQCYKSVANYLSDNATDLEYLVTDRRLTPVRAHEFDAGLDLFASDDYELKQGERVLVNTGVRVKIPRGYVGLLVPRSSLSKSNIVMTNSIGIIDSDYRGDLLASLMYNGMANSRYVDKYEKIVQLLIVPIKLTRLIEGNEYSWVDTDRGIGGFGSTGKH